MIQLRTKDNTNDFLKYFRNLTDSQKKTLFNTIIFDYFTKKSEASQAVNIVDTYRNRFDFRYGSLQNHNFFLTKDINQTENIINLTVSSIYQQISNLQSGDLLIIAPKNKIISKENYEIICIESVINANENSYEVLRNSYSQSKAWSKDSVVSYFCHATSNTPDTNCGFGTRDFNYIQTFQSSSFLSENENDTQILSLCFLNLMTQIERSIFLGNRHCFEAYDDYQVINTTMGGIYNFTPTENIKSIKNENLNFDSICDFFENIFSKSINRENYHNSFEFDFFLGISLYNKFHTILIKNKIKISRQKIFYTHDEFFEVDKISLFGFDIYLRNSIISDLYPNSGFLVPKNSLELITFPDASLLKSMKEEFTTSSKHTFISYIGLLPLCPDFGLLEIE